MARFLPAFALLLALACYGSLVSPAEAAEGVIECHVNPNSRTAFFCNATATVAVGANFTYTVTIGEEAAANQLYDLNVTLRSPGGDADLFVVTPDLNITASERTVGPDVVFAYRSELQQGEYTIVVLGVAASSAFTLTAEAYMPELVLNPEETLALGKILMDCCNKNAAACPDLKASNPGVYLSDGSTDYPDNYYPNFCLYHGNLCTKDHHLLELSMPGQSMQCAFPTASLLKLPKLRRIDLSGNAITGNISAIAASLVNLTALQYLGLSDNKLNGNLNSTCGLAKSGLIAQLTLADNNVSGGVPSCILNAPALVDLRLGANNLSGMLPAIAATSPLVTLLLNGQMGAGLTGGVPALNKLKKLTYVDLSRNAFSGPLPMLPAQLWDVDLSSNRLSGNIPTSYGTLTSLLSLDLEGNQLAGTLPPGLAALPALRELDCSSNSLTGPLPKDWDSARQLVLLYLQNNQLTGKMPGSMADMEKLVVLSLSGNQLSGDLADYAFASSEDRNDINSALRFLDLGNTGLSGNLHAFGGLRDLGVFSTGSFSTEQTILAVQAAVPRTLDLSANSFTGQFPDWLVDGLVSAPEHVNVNLTGSIFTCPIGGFQLSSAPPAGRLAGLHCYAAASSALVEVGVTAMATVESQVILPKQKMSAGAAFAIFVCVVLILGAIGGVGYMLWQRRVRTQGQAYSGRFQSFADVAPPGGPNKFNYNSWDTQIEMSGNSYGARSEGIKSGASSVHSTRPGH